MSITNTLRPYMTVVTIAVAIAGIALLLSISNQHVVSGLSCARSSDQLSPADHIRAAGYVFEARVIEVVAHDDVEISDSFSSKPNRQYEIVITEGFKGVDTGEHHTIVTNGTWGPQLGLNKNIIGVFPPKKGGGPPGTFVVGLCESNPSLITASYKEQYDEYKFVLAQPEAIAALHSAVYYLKSWSFIIKGIIWVVLVLGIFWLIVSSISRMILILAQKLSKK